MSLHTIRRRRPLDNRWRRDAFNAHLMARLAALLPGCAVQPTDARGLPAMQVEATAFAWLAQAHCERRPGNLPSVTGATGSRVLGARYPR